MSTHSYNPYPLIYQRHYHQTQSSARMFQRGPGINVNRDKSSYSINVSTRTRSTWLQSRELSTPLPLGAISFFNILHGHKYATINAKSIGIIPTLFIKTRNDYSLAVICTESLYQLALFLHVRLELGLSNVITRVLRCFL